LIVDIPTVDNPVFRPFGLDSTEAKVDGSAAELRLGNTSVPFSVVGGQIFLSVPAILSLLATRDPTFTLHIANQTSSTGTPQVNISIICVR
jgi:hypothetical protein